VATAPTDTGDDAPAPIDDPARAERKRRLAEIDEQGYTVVEGAIEPDLVAALLEDLDRLHRELGTVPSRNGFEGTKTLRVYNLLAHGPLWQQVPVHESVLPIVERVLDPGCLVSSLSSISIGPGEVAQPIHSDDQLIPLPRPHVPVVCNSMWALTDFTEANGATRLVPSSHKLDHHPDYGHPYDSIPAEMPAGSVLIWNGSLWHGGGANATDETRVGIAMNYCAGWVRQQENQQLGIPVEVARTFSPRLRELCGFGVYHALIGHIDRRSPADVVLGPAPGEEAEAGGDGMVWDRG
jgi:ectoine hydroxylase-related dioxygenase (phytanoyl-CoA dioxygenase family)